MKAVNMVLVMAFGLFLYSCSSNQTTETVRPNSPVPASTTEAATPKEEAFNKHLNDLIRQLGDYDYKKQKAAATEIQALIDNFIKTTAENPEYDSPELDYLISAMDYAAEKGSPPDKEGMVDPALQALAIELWRPAKWRLIVHPDLVKLNPEIGVRIQNSSQREVIQNDDERMVINWLSSQEAPIQKNAVQLYKYLLRSSDPAVWQDTIQCLIKIGSLSQALSLLRSNDKEKMMIVIDIITKTKDPTFITYLMPLLKHTDASVRMEITNAILVLGGTPVIKEMLPMISATDSTVITQLTFFVSRLEDSAAINDLLPMLKHKSEELRRKAAGVILKLGGRQIMNDIIPEDADTVILEEIDSFIRGMDDKSCIDDLLPLLHNKYAILRLAALDIISRFGDKTTIKYFMPLLKDDSSEIKDEILRFMMDEFRRTGVNASDKLLVNDIIPLLKDKDAKIRLFALDVIVQLGGIRDVISDIIPLLKDSDNMVRGRSLGYLKNLNDPTITAHFITLLHDDDMYIRVSAIEALVYMGVADKSPLLEGLFVLMKENQEWIKLRAAETLEVMCRQSITNKHQVIDQLVPLFRSEHHYIRYKSILIAGVLDTTYLLKSILPLLKDAEDIRLLSAQALTELKDIRAVPIWVEYADKDKKLEYPAPDATSLIRNVRDLASEGLTKLTGKTIKGDSTAETAKLWKDWWAKEGQKWYEEEVKKIKDK